MPKLKKISKTNQKKFRLLFESQREELLKQNDDVVVDDSGDDVDLAQGLALHEMLERLSFRDKETLVKINEALKRLDDGSFGLCEDCEQSIPEKRLVAIPLAALCVGCAEAQEKLKKQYR